MDDTTVENTAPEDEETAEGAEETGTAEDGDSDGDDAGDAA